MSFRIGIFTLIKQNKCYFDQSIRSIFTKNIDFTKSKILIEYESRVRLKQIHDDPHQTAIIQRLLQLDEQLNDYQPSLSSSSSSILSESSPSNLIVSKLSSLFGGGGGGSSKKSKSESECSNQPVKNRGLYLHGNVGCGKTMLMDLFFDNCSVDPRKRRRVHFHSFMLDFHNRFHQHKQRRNESRNVLSSTMDGRKRASFDFDPIPIIAQDIVEESWFICLDEFQVTDIGDAMILKHFFKQLFAHGMVMIATSNRPPDELYKGGLQRSNFLPFIDLLKKHCDVYELASGIDYRRLVDSKKHQVYYINNKDTDKTINLMFKVLANNENDSIRPKTLTIKGRNVTLKRTCGGVLDSSFAELCDQPLGAIDYLTIAQYYHTVIIRDIPKLTMKLRGQARRFITMIDTFYDHHVRCMFTSDVPCDELFQVQRIEDVLANDDNRKLMDDLGMTSDDLNASIFSGEEEMFAFERALSRLYEMQTIDYWNANKNLAKNKSFF
ncbi:Lactation elevated protein 1 [Dermatophagoides pteronyssinus]|uniref:Lactation elevated protein 1 n=1 Tax=Dermatophagoides pteronyssinus TaxID=6956 RepID=A0ABQ8J6U5_DERPT|nr:Lactation elevated protein 1 [Dermatophagoides pteronyssinus]